MASQKSATTLAKFIKGAASTPDPPPVGIQPELPPTQPTVQSETPPQPRRKRPDRKNKVRIMLYVEPKVADLLQKAADRLDRQVAAMLRRTLEKITEEYTDEKGHPYLD